MCHHVYTIYLNIVLRHLYVKTGNLDAYTSIINQGTNRSYRNNRSRESVEHIRHILPCKPFIQKIHITLSTMHIKHIMLWISIIESP
ncbi:hypothetical protein EUGRSUZ_K00417 [Eucalyptus grandis]|uniref:Uncharacterized protein n=2 Tax=Eucalyptus grandis TaxID=71139 RepID=A0ACC3IQ77_EUCGR|nr:hypothetical protein EUGRSUZ_K00417 [Eucalyptus grandis]